MYHTGRCHSSSHGGAEAAADSRLSDNGNPPVSVAYVPVRSVQVLVLVPVQYSTCTSTGIQVQFELTTGAPVRIRRQASLQTHEHRCTLEHGKIPQFANTRTVRVRVHLNIFCKYTRNIEMKF